MVIKISDIPPRGLTVELADKIDLFGEEKAGTAFSAVLTIEPSGSGVLHISGTVEAAPELVCSKCLKRFPFPIKDTAMSLDLILEGSLSLGEERELNRSELDVDFFRGDEIDPLEFIREQLLLDIPMVPVHSPECKGLCPVCGTDLNAAACGCDRNGGRETSPFAVLRKLKPPKE